VSGIATGLVSVIALLAVASSGREASALAAHAWMTAVAALLAAIVLAGSGIRTSGFQPDHPSLQYTLTLPVARPRWIVTRFAAGLAGTLLSVAVLFAVDVLGYLVADADPPIGRMLHASVTIGSVAVVTGTVFGVVLPIWRDWMQPAGGAIVLSTVAIFASNALNGYSPSPGMPRPIPALLERPPDAWAVAAATVLIVAGLVRLAVAIARRQDF
jgi:hypothetical protein